MANLGEFVGSGSGTTKLLLHMEGNANDSSGNSNNGTSTNITYSQANGKFGQGAGFNGSSSYIGLPGNNLGITNGAITMSCWVKMNSEISSGTQTFFAHLNSSTYTKDYIWYDYNGGSRRLIFSHTKNFVGGADVVYSITMGTTNWYHLVLTYDGTVENAYVDGKFVGTASTTGTGTTQQYSGISIGARYKDNGSTLEAFSNIVADECIIENRAWSASEVKKYYTYAKGRFGII